jgi:hypothetical protein
MVSDWLRTVLLIASQLVLVHMEPRILKQTGSNVIIFKIRSQGDCTFDSALLNFLYTLGDIYYMLVSVFRIRIRTLLVSQIHIRIQVENFL